MKKVLKMCFGISLGLSLVLMFSVISLKAATYSNTKEIIMTTSGGSNIGQVKITETGSYNNVPGTWSYSGKGSGIDIATGYSAGNYSRGSDTLTNDGHTASHSSNMTIYRSSTGQMVGMATARFVYNFSNSKVSITATQTYPK